MSDLAIRVEDLSKRYRIGALYNPRDTIQEYLSNLLTAPIRRLRNRSRDIRNSSPSTIWALSDISFEVQRGEIVGIIGRNGAGKTTLLKVISRITEPTGGRIEIRGRVGSLLEVGTGFHPELTGRENVYLNGAILGMKKAEIDRKFDEIVEFSGVAKFIDTPVKRYSTGMGVRLAFSVAAHLDPDILLIDEVLAVGDVEFQRRCLGKMRDVTKEGRTILFVSHNMAAIRSLCDRALLIEQGALVMDSATEPVVAKYLDQNLTMRAVVSAEELQGTEKRDQRSDQVVRCVELKMLGPDGLPRTVFQSDEEITLCITYECLKTSTDFSVIAYIVDELNTPILITQSLDDPDSSRHYHRRPGLYRTFCVFPKNLFGEKRFCVSLRLETPMTEVITLDKIISFDVMFLGYNNNRSRGWKDTFIRPRFNWRTEAVTTRESMFAED